MDHRNPDASVWRRAGHWVRQVPLIAWMIVLAGLVGLAMWVFSGLAAQEREQVLGAAQAEKSQTEHKLSEFAERMLAACSDDSPVRDDLHEMGLCREAVEAKKEVSEPESPVPFRVVRDAVSAYFADHPVKDGESPTPEDILPIVQRVVEDVYAANPPEDGKTPTTEELLELIQQVYAANPPDPGKDGRSITSTQITDDGHLWVTFSDGETTDVGRVVGSPGVGVESVSIREDNHLWVTYTDGSEHDAGELPRGETTCPEGYSFRERSVDHDGNEGTPEETWLVCTRDPEPTEPG